MSDRGVGQVSAFRARRAYEVAKRALDLLGATAGLVFLLPVLGAIGMLIAMDSRGAIIHRTWRLGKNGKMFLKYKFRTMLPNGEKLLEELLARDPAVREEYRATYKIRNDPRVTRVGRFLRRASLDELPQLVNVLKGEMSLVGPRDILPQELEDHYGQQKELFLSVKPGITGLWQVSGRSRLPYPERVRLDLQYIEQRSLWLDLRILAKTGAAVLRGDGAT